MSYSEALEHYRQAEFQKALEILNQIDLNREALELKADTLLELGEFSEAEMLYDELESPTQAGFAAILAGDLERALEHYLAAPFSAAQKWGFFLCDFLSNPLRPIPSPGFLTFRLYFEASFSYFLRFDLGDYTQKILDNSNHLKIIYPELEREINRAKKFAASPI